MHGEETILTPIVPPSSYENGVVASMTLAGVVDDVVLTNALVTLDGQSIYTFNIVNLAKRVLLGRHELSLCIPWPLDVGFFQLGKKLETIKRRLGIPLEEFKVSRDLALSLPRHEPTLMYFQRVRKSPVQWLKMLLNYVGTSLSDGLPETGGSTVKVLELTYATFLFTPVFDYRPQILLKCTEPAKCDLLVDLITYGLPYTATGLANRWELKRNLIFYNVYGLTSGEMRQMSRYALRFVFLNEWNRCQASVGVIATYTPQLVKKLCNVRPVLCDERFPAVVQIEGDMQSPVIFIPIEVRAPDGEKMFLDGEGLKPLEVAIFMALAHEVRRQIRNIDNAITRGEKTWWSSIPPDVFNAYWRHVVMAELLGREYAEALVQYLKVHGNATVSTMRLT